MKAIEYREWNDLSNVEQEAAINHFFNLELQQAAIAPESYKLLHPELYNAIVEAIAFAYEEAMDWATEDMIDQACGDELMKIAQQNAEMALYEDRDNEVWESVVSLSELFNAMNKEN